MDIIKGRNLTIGYNGNNVLTNLTFGFPAGEITVILGRSGCGKSTLLKTLIGLNPPVSGELEVAGETVDFYSEDSLRLVYRKIGVLYQNSALLNSLTLYENVALPIRMHYRNLPHTVERHLVESRLNQVDLKESGEKYPSELSGGMKKRGALARALVLEPEIILCDEPSAGLDPMTSAEIDALLIKLRQDFHMTIVVVTHELRSIEKIADRVMVLHAGKVHFWGKRKDLFSREDPFMTNFFLK
jgi:phospholipid/cholesterol/gamma-HCH transport system ATP-binding protein